MIAKAVQFIPQSPHRFRMEVGLDHWRKWALQGETGVVILAVSKADVPGILNGMISPPASRKHKHKARPLWTYFRGQSGIMMLDTDYRMPGQALRGLKSLPVQLAGHAVGAICLVVLPPAAFGGVWDRTLTREPYDLTCRWNGYRQALVAVVRKQPAPEGPRGLSRDGPG